MRRFSGFEILNRINWICVGPTWWIFKILDSLERVFSGAPVGASRGLNKLVLSIQSYSVW